MEYFDHRRIRKMKRLWKILMVGALVVVLVLAATVFAAGPRYTDANGDGIRETMVDSYQIAGKSPLEWLRGRDSEFANFNYERDGGKYFRFPIPSRELPLVEGLEQNPGW